MANIPNQTPAAAPKAPSPLEAQPFERSILAEKHKQLPAGSVEVLQNSQDQTCDCLDQITLNYLKVLVLLYPGAIDRLKKHAIKNKIGNQPKIKKDLKLKSDGEFINMMPTYFNNETLGQVLYTIMGHPNSAVAGIGTKLGAGIRKMKSMIPFTGKNYAKNNPAIPNLMDLEQGEENLANLALQGAEEKVKLPDGKSWLGKIAELKENKAKVQVDLEELQLDLTKKNVAVIQATAAKGALEGQITTLQNLIQIEKAKQEKHVNDNNLSGVIEKYQNYQYPVDQFKFPEGSMVETEFTNATGGVDKIYTLSRGDEQANLKNIFINNLQISLGPLLEGLGHTKESNSFNAYISSGFIVMFESFKKARNELSQEDILKSNLFNYLKGNTLSPQELENVTSFISDFLKKTNYKKQFRNIVKSLNNTGNVKYEIKYGQLTPIVDYFTNESNITQYQQRLSTKQKQLNTATQNTSNALSKQMKAQTNVDTQTQAITGAETLLKQIKLDPKLEIRANVLGAMFRSTVDQRIANQGISKFINGLPFIPGTENAIKDSIKNVILAQPILANPDLSNPVKYLQNLFSFLRTNSIKLQLDSSILNKMEVVCLNSYNNVIESTDLSHYQGVDSIFGDRNYLGHLQNTVFRIGKTSFEILKWGAGGTVVFGILYLIFVGVSDKLKYGPITPNSTSIQRTAPANILKTTPQPTSYPSAPGDTTPKKFRQGT